MHAARDTAYSTILLVDDDRMSTLAIQRALKNLSVQTPTRLAQNGYEALDILKTTYFKTGDTPPALLVILDNNMPRMNGLEFLTKVRQTSYFKSLTVFYFEHDPFRRGGTAPSHPDVTAYLSKDELQPSLARALNALDRPPPQNPTFV